MPKCAVQQGAYGVCCLACRWVRDVSFGEGKCQFKVGHAPQNMAAFRNAAISLPRLRGYKEIAATLGDFSDCPLKLLKFLGVMKN